MYDQLPKTQPLPNKTIEALGSEHGDQDYSQSKSLHLIEEAEEQIVWKSRQAVADKAPT